MARPERTLGARRKPDGEAVESRRKRSAGAGGRAAPAGAPAAAVAPDRQEPLAPAAAPAERSLERYLGNIIRDLRQRDHLTIADVASQAGISRGMLSKIENGQAATSLDTLSRIAQALGVSLAHLFRDYNVPSGGAQLVKSEAGMEVVRRGTRRGHTYHLLAYDKGPRKTFEPFLITMDDASEVFPSFEHPGTEFIYMLKGRIEYRHGRQTYLLEPGDALTFRGEVPHGPEKLLELPIHFLSIIIYGEDKT
jgi:transcriptional regulator with XRE-family HTH domain